MDVDRPHVGLVVGKRGSGKTYTLGVLAEGLLAAEGVAPVVVDPMGSFTPLDTADVSATVVDPSVRADALDPRQWCTVLGLDPERGAGALVWRAASECPTLDGMRSWVAGADTAASTGRAAANHLSLAASWDVFDTAGIEAETLCSDGLTVLDMSGLASRPAGAALAAVATALYDARLADQTSRLPWLLVDEAHAFTDGVARRPLRRLVTRGRQPGVSCVLATQRPSAVPATTVSQTDLLVAHRLTSTADIDALQAAQPTYLDGDFAARLPETTGDALVVDDGTESVHHVTVRERRTPHGGETPRASDLG
jgi:DNA helicase HerA-like ATPase